MIGTSSRSSPETVTETSVRCLAGSFTLRDEHGTLLTNVSYNTGGVARWTVYILEC